MTDLLHLLASSLILGTCAWASNIWPGIENWSQAAVSRLLWWGGPFAVIAAINGADWDHAIYLGLAAWLGAWIPHTAMPDIRSYSTDMLVDLGLVVVRVLALLALPTGLFWLSGAFWPAMICATAGALPCVMIGILVTPPLPGLRTPGQVSGVLFGLSTGAWIAVAILAPTLMTDHLL